jgi:maltose alpha-D-glucosyltransferase/alpha-amylase
MDWHWYKDAVLYDVDVRSFYDGDGDGIGDLRGLSDKLDYVQELGATAVVLEQSDVASVSDLDPFLRDARERGLRVITQLLVDETSDRVLNVDHPRVRRAVLNVMRHWFDAGVDGLRLDGIPNLVTRERPGERPQLETHVLVKEMRQVIDREYPGRLLLADTNRPPDEVAAYFGTGDECQMAFNASLRQQLLMALQLEDRQPIAQALRRAPEIPPSCQWALFLRHQDPLSPELRSTERDAIRQADAAGAHMRLNAGTCRRLAPLFENDRRRIELAYALLCSLPGSPVIYYGNEIGMGDNIDLGDAAGVRTPMQWSRDRNGGFSRADPARLCAPVNADPVYGFQVVNVKAQRQQPFSLFNWMRRLIAVRRQYTAFGRGTIEILEPRNQRVLAYIRRSGDERILVIANFSGKAQSVDLLLSFYAGTQPVELLGGTEFHRIGAGPYALALGPYSFYWLMLSRRAARPSRSRDIAVAAVSHEAGAGDAAATPA